MKKLYRSESNKLVAGVLGGLGEYFNVDPTLLRVIFLILLIPSFSTVAIAYLIAALIMPKGDVY
ncbi:PspC domain-containing protein [Oceanobacillus sp. J11TS1]|uniref:PspC domain-containing protein n=1 Tax=Oceanobacillus sp. J11TS1 TaxID=2807191 RepID=UPI001B1FEEBF|nr:PspC domain-containing protein [Oceanobacillus sp. J11TS1]GIO23896.1 PspC domain-containing protein [Oceanobacillus sp. J11TS1]